MRNVENGDFYETKLEFGNLDLRQKVNFIHRHSRSRLLTHRIGGVTCMIGQDGAGTGQETIRLYREINVFRDLKRLVAWNRFESTFFGNN